MSNTTNYLFEKLPRGYQNYDVPINSNFDKIDTEIKNRANEIGNISNLETTDKTSMVNATNEIVHKVGDLLTLNTTNKADLVQAINENVTQLADIVQDVIGRGINVRNLGYLAYGDGIHDDTEAVQRAFDNAGDGGVVFFPYTPNNKYKITAPIIVRHNDVRVYANPKAEYATTISAFEPTMPCIFDVRGYGFSTRNIQLEQDSANVDNPPTVKGIVYNMEHGGAPSTDYAINANIDSEIMFCGFINLETPVVANGRNVFIHYNIFSNCINGIKINLFPNAECRGYRITHNRFHSIGYNGAIANSKCIELPEVDTLLLYGNEIENNFADFCSTFIKGNVQGSKVTDNFCYNVLGGSFIENMTTTSVNSSAFQTQIDGNIFEGLLITQSTQNQKSAEYGIYIKNMSNVFITNNTFKNVIKDLIKTENCGVVITDDNILTNPDLLYFINGHQYNGITLINNYKNIVSNNTIRSTSTAGESNIKYGIYVSSDTSTILYSKGNIILDYMVGEMYLNNCKTLSAYQDVETFKNAIELYRDENSSVEQHISFKRRNTNSIKFEMFNLSATNLSLTAGVEKSKTSIKNMCNGVLTEMISLNYDKTVQIPEGTWNGAHFMLGSYHIWVDSTGKLRIKSSAPTSDLDGIIIGVQA